MTGGDLNKRALESLIKCGAFDSFGIRRTALMVMYESILDSASEERRNNVAGQINLFGGSAGQPAEELRFPNVPEFTLRDKLLMEKEVAGMYISGHPMDEYIELVEGTGFVPLADICRVTQMNEDGLFEQVDTHFSDNDEVSVCGIITKKIDKVTKAGKQMAFFTIEDVSGEIEVIAFPAMYANVSRYKVDDAVVIRARLSIREDEAVKLIAMDMAPLIDAAVQGKKLYIKMRKDNRELQYITAKLKSNSGIVPVCLYFEDTKEKVMAEKNLWITPRASLLEDLKKHFGAFNIKFV